MKSQKSCKNNTVIDSVNRLSQLNLDEGSSSSQYMAGFIDAKGATVRWAQGQDFTFTLMLGSGIRYNFSPKYSMSLGPAYMHVSNLYMSEPKLLDNGINVWGGMVGFNVRLGRDSGVAATSHKPTCRYQTNECIGDSASSKGVRHQKENRRKPLWSDSLELGPVFNLHPSY